MEKFKKYIPYILIIVFVGWFGIKFFADKTMSSKEEKMAIDWGELDRPSANEENQHGDPKTLAHNHENHTLDDKALDQLEDETNFVAFEKMEEEWLQEMETLMGDKFYAQYLNMRDRNEKEKMQAYNEYHKHLKNKYGDKFSYNISEDQSKKENEINQSYLRELNALVGDRKFKDYLKARDKVNEDNRKQNKLFVQIEF